jgi:glycosyl transferase family 25
VRALYINLDRQPGRRASIEAQGARLGLALERIPAVDGRAIPEAERARLVPPDADPPLSASEVACTMSHMEAWRSIAASADPWGLVLEDDVFLAADLAAWAGDPGWIPPDAEVVRLASSHRPVRLDASPTLERGGRALVRLRSPALDLGGYLISARHAAAALAHPRPFARPVDRMLIVPDRAVIYQLCPAAVVQAKYADFAFLAEDDAATQIQNERIRRRRGAGEKLRGELRNLYAKAIAPAVLLLAQPFRPADRRLRIATVPFRR